MPTPIRRCGINGAVFFDEPAVVGAHEGFIGVVVFDAAPKFGPALLRREQNFGVDAVALLFFYALFGLPVPGVPSYRPSKGR